MRSLIDNDEVHRALSGFVALFELIGSVKRLGGLGGSGVCATEFAGELTESAVATTRPELPPRMTNTKDSCHYAVEIFMGLKPSALALSVISLSTVIAREPSLSQVLSDDHLPDWPTEWLAL